MIVATEVPSADLVTCTHQQLEAMGYEIETSDVEPGVVRARKRITGTVFRLLGQSRYSGMVADIDEPPAGLRYSVTVFTVDEEYWGVARDEYGPPMVDGENEARRLVATCAPDAPENPLRPDPVG